MGELYKMDVILLCGGGFYKARGEQKQPGSELCDIVCWGAGLLFIFLLLLNLNKMQRHAHRHCEFIIKLFLRGVDGGSSSLRCNYQPELKEREGAR